MDRLRPAREPHATWDKALGSADLDDLEPEYAARSWDLGLLATLVDHSCLTDLASHQALVLVVILLAGSDQREVFLFVEIEVEDADFGSEGNSIGRRVRLIDDVRLP